MGDRYSGHIQRLREAVFGSGVTPRSVREAAAARATGQGADAGLPAELAPLVDKVARHAHRITTEDIEALRAAGHTEDGIYEVTVAAAVGAGLRRLDRGLAALKGAASR